jgi:hypothetical protein
MDAAADGLDGYRIGNGRGRYFSGRWLQPAPSFCARSAATAPAKSRRSGFWGARG